MDGIRKVGGTRSNTSVPYRAPQKSTALNRKFVKKPVAPTRVVTRAEKEREAFLRRQEIANQINRERLAEMKAMQEAAAKTKKPDGPVIVHPMAARAQEKMNTRAAQAKATTRISPKSAQELKEAAIKQALAQMDKMDKPAMAVIEQEVVETIGKKRRFWQSKRFVLALSLSAASVLVLGYFVHLNMPDISVRVAASRAGVDGKYPSFLPRGYDLDGLVSENSGRVEMTFKNGEEQFMIIQENSSWDSNALYSNYVATDWGEGTEILREQGLTIYVNGSDAAWVNGGVKYVIDDAAEGLTKQELRDIAVSF